MKEVAPISKSRLGLVLMGAALLLLAAGALVVRLPFRFPLGATITIETNGTARLGMVPLENKMVRTLGLKVVSQIQSSPVSLAVAQPARYREVADMLGAMNRAGITRVMVITPPKEKPQE